METFISYDHFMLKSVFCVIGSWKNPLVLYPRLTEASAGIDSLKLLRHAPT